MPRANQPRRSTTLSSARVTHARCSARSRRTMKNGSARRSVISVHHARWAAQRRHRLSACRPRQCTADATYVKPACSSRPRACSNEPFASKPPTAGSERLLLGWAGAGARRVPNVAAQRRALHSVAPAVSRGLRDRSSVVAARRSCGQGFARSSALTRATGGSHGAAAASEYCDGCRSRCGAGRPLKAPATGLPSDCAKAPRGPERAHLPPPS